MIKKYKNKFIFIFTLLIILILLILLFIFSVKGKNEYFKNIGQIVVEKKNKNIKIISKNIPLSIRQKCNLMRRKYPNLKACIIKKSNYELNKEQLDEIKKKELDKIKKEEISNDNKDNNKNILTGYEWRYLDYEGGVAIKCKDNQTLECSSNDGKTCNWGEEGKYDNLEILNKVNGKKKKEIKCPGWNMPNNKFVCELLKCDKIKSPSQCINPFL